MASSTTVGLYTNESYMEFIYSDFDSDNPDNPDAQRFCEFDTSVSSLNFTEANNPQQNYYFDYNFNCFCWSMCTSVFAYRNDHIAYHLSVWASLFTFILGFTGNHLILAMFIGKELNTMPSRPFFISLAIFDNSVLFMGPLDHFLWTSYHFTLQDAWFACKPVKWLYESSLMISAWLVVLLTVDRYIGVRWPLKASIIRPRHRTTATCIVIMVSLILHSHILVYVSWELYITGFPCQARINYVYYSANMYLKFSTYAVPWINFLTRFLVPGGIIVACNIAMVGKIRRSESGDVSSTKVDNQVSQKLTRVFMVISISFVVTMLPNNIYFICEYLLGLDTEGGYTHRVDAINNLLSEISLAFMYTNYASNFYLYCISGQKFRSALKSLLTCRCRE